MVVGSVAEELQRNETEGEREREKVDDADAARVKVEVHLDPQDLRRALRFEARAGLTGTPKELSPKWFYDERGSRLFEQITHLPEYYPTRREREILQAHAADIAQPGRADTLVELGSGVAEKTRLLLTAMQEEGSLLRYVPFDVDEATLRASARRIAREYPELLIQGVVGDFERHLPAIPKDGRRLVAFLGGTIGNFKPLQRQTFLAQLAESLSTGDSLLLGTDLRKDEARLNAAYNDAAGVTAAFNLNLLNGLNDRRGGEFDPSLFTHEARFIEERGWVEMLLRSRREQRVRLGALALTVHFDEDEVLRTEVSTKFLPEQVEAELSAAGFTLAEWWTDDLGDYAVSLAFR